MTLPVLKLKFARRPTVEAEFAKAYVGPPGQGGSSTYTHTQTLPLATWTVAHNLGRRPSVTVTDHLGNVVLADVRYVDNDLIQINHSAPLAGFAYVN